MQRVPARRGRVTVWRMDLGPRGRGVLAYVPLATDDRGFGDTAVIASVAGTPGEGADLFPVATAATGSLTEEVLARWLICMGWAARLTKAPSNADLPDTEWAAELARTVRLEKSAYGHEALAVGRIELPPDAMAQAAALVPVPA
ncbi:hypothetical protein [Wenjunlia vitaminophila]|nr:hypothetical protein [Wenjunlia vitaminophila]